MPSLRPHETSLPRRGEACGLPAKLPSLQIKLASCRCKLEMPSRKLEESQRSWRAPEPSFSRSESTLRRPYRSLNSAARACRDPAKLAGSRAKLRARPINGISFRLKLAGCGWKLVSVHSSLRDHDPNLLSGGASLNGVTARYPLQRLGGRSQRIEDQPLAPRLDEGRGYDRLPALTRLPVRMPLAPEPEAWGYVADLHRNLIARLHP